MSTTAVVIGRFQPFHNGHLALIQEAAKVADRVVVILGSAGAARSAKNPFFALERMTMIQRSVGEELRARLEFEPGFDHYDDDAWVEGVKALVDSNVTSDDRVVLVGHEKDASSYYLKAFPFWGYHAIEATFSLDATQIREAMFERGQEGLDENAQFLPAGCLEYLREWVEQSAYVGLAEEHKYIKSYKTAWSKAPYPPVLVTVDSVIVHRNKVLMVRRNGMPGRNLLALPGGFLDPNETTLNAALRETQEETGLGPEIRKYLAAHETFGHPNRSQLGRVITFAYLFKLDDSLPQPTASAGDDASSAGWVPIAKLDELAGKMHDDHLHIIQKMLSLK